MKQYYLMMDKKAREDFDTHSEQILRYICDTFLIDVAPYAHVSDESGTEYRAFMVGEPSQFITVNKLESRTWQEYLSDAMKNISESEFVVQLEVGSNNGRYLQDIILEKYCKLIGVRVHTLRIDENAWHRICIGGLPSFVYSQLPNADIYNDKSEDWKE